MNLSLCGISAFLGPGDDSEGSWELVQKHHQSIEKQTEVKQVSTMTSLDIPNRKIPSPQ